MATTTFHKSIIPAVITLLGLICAITLLAGSGWFRHTAMANVAASPRGGVGVTASGQGDPPWTGGVMDPPWT